MRSVAARDGVFPEPWGLIFLLGGLAPLTIDHALRSPRRASDISQDHPEA